MAEHISFNGQDYYKNTRGYWVQRKNSNKSLHVAIWEFTNGAVPEGYVIHHKDFNPSNNTIENLQCMTRAEHTRLHRLQEQPKFKGVCTCCGKEFISKRPAKFCSKECRRQTQYTHYYEARNCAVCGKTFSTRKDSKTKCCSGYCADRLWRTSANNTNILANPEVAVPFIRENYQRGSSDYNYKTLAEKFGVSPSAIQKIINGETYKNV